MRNAGAIDINNSLIAKRTNSLIYNGKAWVSQTTYQRSIQFLQAIKFEHITDGECWLRGSGRITVRMKAQKDLFIFTGPPREIQVYSGGDSFFDIPGITNQLASIMFEQLRRNPALLHFTGMTATNIKLGWGGQAQQWLIDDIRADPDVCAYLLYRPEEGRKIVVKNAFRRNPIELEIEFKQGLCHFDDIMGQFVTKITAQYDNIIIFTHPQLASAKRTIAPKLVEAVRAPNFSHPYPDHAIKSVLAMKDMINSFADELGATPISLAGVLADEYEKDLAPKVEQASADLESFLIAVVTQNYDSINFSLGVYLSILANVAKTGSAYWEAADIFWTLLPDNQKNTLLTTGAIAVKRGLTEHLKTMLSALGAANDFFSDLDRRLRLNMETAQEELKNFKPDQCGQDLKEFAVREGLLNLIKFCYAIRYGGGRESIKSRATKIQVHLSQVEQPSGQREYVCKWERLYTHFKA